MTSEEEPGGSGGPDRALLAAAAAFAAAAGLGSVVAIRDELPGESRGVGLEDLVVANDRPIGTVAQEIMSWLGWE